MVTDTTMKYGVTKNHIGFKNFLEITSVEFEAAKNAKQNLIEVLGIEEKFNMILENFEEFERELLEISLRHMLFFNFSWSSFQKNSNTISRRLINLLTTCRLYFDQTPHNIKSIYGNDSEL